MELKVNPENIGKKVLVLDLDETLFHCEQTRLNEEDIEIDITDYVMQRLGVSGYTGYTGTTGMTGPGDTGWTGYTGYTGYTGSTGYTGWTGDKGANYAGSYNSNLTYKNSDNDYQTQVVVHNNVTHIHVFALTIHDSLLTFKI